MLYPDRAFEGKLARSERIERVTARRFEGRAALVTGGASGIGAATTRRLVGEGANVLIADRDRGKGEALASELTAVSFQPCDVSEASQIETLVQRAEALFGRVDILFNNAGIGGANQDSTELDPAIWRQVMTINIDAVFHTCRLVIPVMRGHGGGVIVNTASISGLAGDHNFTAYNASKAAVINYTKALALDHAKDNIRVNAVCPGLIDTALTAGLSQVPALLEHWKSHIPMRRAGTAEEIAAVVCFLASEEASYMTGSIVVADGGVTAGTGQPDMKRFLTSREKNEGV
jgi:meso-butanediol dehydrogenase/(S,S)-butanediol dehydrogenase/diacetyl reductase